MRNTDRRNTVLRNIGLAAVVMLAPGGFILGATLAANHYRKRRGGRHDAPSAAPEETATDGAAPAGEA